MLFSALQTTHSFIYAKPGRNGSLRPDFTSGFIGAMIYGRTEAELRTIGLAFQKIAKT